MQYEDLFGFFLSFHNFKDPTGRIFGNVAVVISIKARFYPVGSKKIQHFLTRKAQNCHFVLLHETENPLFSTRLFIP